MGENTNSDILDGGGKGSKSSTVTTRHVTASQNWAENKTQDTTVAFWSQESVKSVIQNFVTKKKGHICYIFKIFRLLISA